MLKKCVFRFDNLRVNYAITVTFTLLKGPEYLFYYNTKLSTDRWSEYVSFHYLALLCSKTLGTSIYVDITFICTHLGNSAPQRQLPAGHCTTLHGKNWPPEYPQSYLASTRWTRASLIPRGPINQSSLVRWGGFSQHWASGFNVVAAWCILDGLLRRHVSLSLWMCCNLLKCLGYKMLPSHCVL